MSLIWTSMWTKLLWTNVNKNCGWIHDPFVHSFQEKEVVVGRCHEADAEKPATSYKLQIEYIAQIMHEIHRVKTHKHMSLLLLRWIWQFPVEVGHCRTPLQFPKFDQSKTMVARMREKMSLQHSVYSYSRNTHSISTQFHFHPRHIGDNCFIPRKIGSAAWFNWCLS